MYVIFTTWDKMNSTLANDECTPSDIRDYRVIWLIPSSQIALYIWRTLSHILILQAEYTLDWFLVAWLPESYISKVRLPNAAISESEAPCCCWLVFKSKCHITFQHDQLIYPSFWLKKL